MARRSKLRSLFFHVHQWTGLGLGVYLLLIGLTGSVLIFAPEIDSAAIGHLTRSEARTLAVSLDGVLEKAQTFAPDMPLASLDLPGERYQTLRYRFSKPGAVPATVYADPGTGRILGVTHAEKGLLWYFERFHSNLFLDRPGRLANGYGAIALLLLGITGLYIWWPRKVMSVQIGSDAKRFNGDLHSALGFWTSAALLLIAFTGAYFTWPREMMTGVLWLTQTKEPPYTPDSRSGATSIDAMLTAARAAMPDASPTLLRLPSQRNKAVSVQMRVPGEWRENGASPVYLERGTARVLRIDRFSEQPLGYRMYSAFGPLHTGGFGQGYGVVAGWIARVLWFLFGIVPGVLAVTGFLMWWNRKVVPRRKRLAAYSAPVSER